MCVFGWKFVRMRAGLTRHCLVRMLKSRYSALRPPSLEACDGHAPAPPSPQGTRWCACSQRNGTTPAVQLKQTTLFRIQCRCSHHLDGTLMRCVLTHTCALRRQEELRRGTAPWQCAVLVKELSGCAFSCSCSCSTQNTKSQSLVGLMIVIVSQWQPAGL